MVFWHGFDAKRRPCLIIRVQSACFNTVSEEKSRLPEVVGKCSKYYDEYYCVRKKCFLSIIEVTFAEFCS